ncbi:hypothetical protein D3H35_04005 [Cohnella faecalis]|uniref:Uncharacterized protein n=1 Tax=Cohnella faecalis TaxID=2315694 RepID=A0A398CZM8_9BACL|nr:hypothetical protein D3H35_04005 [Cohnella faecalis]
MAGEQRYAVPLISAIAAFLNGVGGTPPYIPYRRANSNWSGKVVLREKFSSEKSGYRPSLVRKNDALSEWQRIRNVFDGKKKTALTGGCTECKDWIGVERNHTVLLLYVSVYILSISVYILF